MVSNMNRDYKDLNMEVQATTSIETTRAPSFKAWGLKRKSSIQTFHRPDLALHENAMGPFVSRLSHFREQNPKFKLHFSSQQKLKMGIACGRYFKALYCLEPSYGETKDESAARLEALKSVPNHAATD